MGDVDKKLPDTRVLVTTTVLNTKISEVENKTPNHDKYITTPEFNKLTAENFAARLAQANLASKNDIAALVKKTSSNDKLKNSNKKVASNKIKHRGIEKKITDLTNKVAQTSEKGYYFLLSRMHFTSNDS